MSRIGIADPADDQAERSLASAAVEVAPDAGRPTDRSDQTEPDPDPRAGGSRELLTLALPLVVSQSFMTVQLFMDTILLSRHDPLEMAASLPAAIWYWLPFGFLQVTAGYVSTFVAQYTGAGRAHRVGPAVWQGIYFAVFAGLAFLVLVPLTPAMIALGGHTDALQSLETSYLRCLCFAALPMLLMAAVNGFFSGRGQTWTVLGIEAAGTAVNLALALVLIFGRLGFPSLGIVGAGWATVAGSWASAVLAVALLFLRRYRGPFHTLAGWRFERELFARLMKYGGPAGVQVFLDVLVFLVFVQLVGRLGEAETGATTLAVRLNMLAFLPMMGMGQAVSILVGQRLGADQPGLAERSAYTGLAWIFGYMCIIAAMYVLIPDMLVGIFASEHDVARFDQIQALVPSILVCVAIYSVADSVNVAFSFALRGAGDTRFVSLLTFALAWPIMVIPTAISVGKGASVYWPWAFATAYIIAMSVCFMLRFRSGRWKSMRVIEAHVAE